MAERRMFAKTILDSDAFLDMPMSSQCLYVHLAMRADDDGFVNSPRKIARMLGASEDDLRLLIAKNFLIGFDSGVIAIKHWRLHNYIQKDRYKETVYLEEKAQLGLKDNKVYTFVSNMDTKCIQPVSKVDTQVRLGKDSIGKSKDSIDSGSSIGGDDVWKRLTTDEIDRLYELFEDAGDLIQAVYEDVKDKGKQIRNTFTYIVGYANKVGWPRR